jgi:hypothetical protein
MPDKPPRELFRFGSFDVAVAGPRRISLRSRALGTAFFCLFVFGLPLLVLTGAQLSGKLSKDMPQTFWWAAGVLPLFVLPVFRSEHSLVIEDDAFHYRERRVSGPTYVRPLARSEIEGLVLSTERQNTGGRGTTYRVFDLKTRDGALVLFSHTWPAKVERAAERAAQATGLPIRRKN